MGPGFYSRQMTVQDCWKWCFDNDATFFGLQVSEEGEVFRLKKENLYSQTLEMLKENFQLYLLTSNAHFSVIFPLFSYHSTNFRLNLHFLNVTPSYAALSITISPQLLLIIGFV